MTKLSHDETVTFAVLEKICAVVDADFGDIVGRIYEYFLNKFAKNIVQDDGVFFTPKSLVKMIVNVLEPTQGILLDPACDSGGMFVQTGDFVEHAGMRANTFYHDDHNLVASAIM